MLAVGCRRGLCHFRLALNQSERAMSCFEGRIRVSYSCLERWSTTSPPSKRRLDVEDFILEFLQALKVQKALDFLEALEVLQVFDV